MHPWMWDDYIICTIYDIRAPYGAGYDPVYTETAEADLKKHQSLSSETLGGELEATGPVHRVLMLDEIAVEHWPRWSDIMNKINVAASNVYSTPHRASENSSNDGDIPPLLSCICGEAVNPSESLDEGIIICCMEDCETKWSLLVTESPAGLNWMLRKRGPGLAMAVCCVNCAANRLATTRPGVCDG
ncbi:hypothetical protein B0H10DRAFT_1957459 [Mycena sp. CBHHK59/15]|nr:hypothetical protein B0H10DRAFT_1957459 [Mycena sp. CBHHK59/15]